MTSIWRRLGVAVYYLAWPGIWLGVRWSIRTRVIISAENAIVVVRPWMSNGKWSLPGGGVHGGEDPLLAAVRETKEETGLALAKSKLQHIRTYTPSESPLTCGYHLFTTSLPSKVTLRPGREIIEARWVSPGELTSANASGDVLQALET